MTDSLGPLERYELRVEAGEIAADDAQLAVVKLLDDLHSRLQQASEVESASWLQRLSQRFAGSDKSLQTPVQGLYMWGGVGRGKTMLMDLFYEGLPPDNRLRLHFHRFMRRVHEGLGRWSGHPNPLLKVADEIAAESNVLCFDEFFVSDIGDAMILGELLGALFDRGVALVATSNVEPAELYRDGLQRRRFLPAIDLLYQHTYVHHIPDGVDFRLRALEQARLYYTPLGPAADDSLRDSFRRLAPEAPVEGQMLVVEGRSLRTVMLADDVVWFDFDTLCNGPRSQNDYIELAMIFHAVVLSDVPVLDASSENAARRFISLVDEFYDHGVKLIISAAAPITELYQGEKLRFEFERTESRLLEMQSHDYLASSHRA